MLSCLIKSRLVTSTLAQRAGPLSSHPAQKAPVLSPARASKDEGDEKVFIIVNGHPPAPLELSSFADPADADATDQADFFDNLNPLKELESDILDVIDRERGAHLEESKRKELQSLFKGYPSLLHYFEMYDVTGAELGMWKITLELSSSAVTGPKGNRTSKQTLRNGVLRLLKMMEEKRLSYPLKEGIRADLLRVLKKNKAI